MEEFLEEYCFLFKVPLLGMKQILKSSLHWPSLEYIGRERAFGEQAYGAY